MTFIDHALFEDQKAERKSKCWQRYHNFENFLHRTTFYNIILGFFFS